MTTNFRYLKIDEPEMLLPEGAPAATAGTVGPIADPLPDTFSDAIDQMGMGLFQRRLIVMGGMGWLIDAMEVLVVAFIMDDVAATFSLSTFSKGLVGSASFFGMLFGVMFWSVYADKHGRRWAFVLTQACIFVAGLASSLAPSFSLLLLSRVAVGFGVGGSLPVTSALVAEFLPTKDRAKILCYISGAFWGFGLICASLLGLLLYRIFGSGQENMWRWYLGLSAAPAALVCVAYRLIPESARYLSVVGRNDEALQVLEEVARVNGKLHVLGLDSAEHVGEDIEARLTSAPASDISTGGGYKKTDVVGSERGVAAAAAKRSMNSYTSGESREQDGDTSVQNGEQDSKRLLASRPEFFGRADEAGVAKAGDVRDLFRTPMLRRVTICVWMFWLFVNISYFGYAFVLPKYYQQIAGGQGDLVYMFTALSGTSLITGSFVSVWLCDENRLGRVGTLMWSSLATALCMLLQAMCCDLAVLFVPLSVVTMLAIGEPCLSVSPYGSRT
ncbi:unnamed protein product [Ascophyllum nodosum]